jgi:hypothetical protein
VSFMGGTPMPRKKLLMIKTLRITSVAAVVLAGIVLASVLVPSLVGFGVGGNGGTKKIVNMLAPLTRILPFGRDDEQVGKILNAPSAVDRFKEQHGDKDQSDQDTTPPLVKQAEVLADIINPKTAAPMQTPATSARIPERPVALPPPSSAKFSLVGTSYSASNPATSCAYVRLADNTYQWFRQGDQIAHYVVKEIRNGSVTCWDGSRNIEMPIEPVPDTASMLETGTALPIPAAPALRQPVVGKVPGPPMTQPVTSTQDLPSANLSNEDQEALGDLVNRLKELDTDPTNRAAAANKLISEFRSSRVSAEEAEKLGDLGEELNGNKDSLKEERRREFLRRLSAPRSTKN